jgi:hypothetical protein
VLVTTRINIIPGIGESHQPHTSSPNKTVLSDSSIAALLVAFSGISTTPWDRWKRNGEIGVPWNT